MGLKMVEGLKIIDNFFDDPDQVRAHALSLRTYEPCDFYARGGIFSGYRTKICNEQIEKYIIERIEKIFQRKVLDLSCVFHLNTNTSVFGCPHTDNGGIRNSDIAGVIYLNTNAPVNSGTSLYESEAHPIENFYAKMQILYDVALPPHNFIKANIAKEIKEFKSKLKVDAYSENIYNRLIMYPASVYHSPENYFGETLEDGRLTIALHGKFAD
jgi:hypothetical protein